MAEFDESKHPRDEQGRFTNGGAKIYRQNTSYDAILQEGTQGLSKYKTKHLQSIVFEHISTYRKMLNKKEYVIFSVSDCTRFYQIKLFDSSNDYKYEVLTVEDIDNDG